MTFQAVRWILKRKMWWECRRSDVECTEMCQYQHEIGRNGWWILWILFFILLIWHFFFLFYFIFSYFLFSFSFFDVFFRLFFWRQRNVIRFLIIVQQIADLVLCATKRRNSIFPTKNCYKCYFFKNNNKNHTWNHSLTIFVLCITVFASSFWKNQQKIIFFFLTSNKFEKRRRKHEKCVNWFILIYFNVYLRWNIVCLHIQNTW